MAARNVGHHNWALLGARVRLGQMEAERAAILRAFPNLKRAIGTDADFGRPKKRKRRISAAARQAMSAGMKRFWARRKAQQKSQSSAR